MFSELALKVYTLKKEGRIKSNFQFWKNFFDEQYIKSIEIDNKFDENELKNVDFHLVCAFDKEFPNVENIKPSERPYLFAYKGNIDLLGQIDKNVAVIGVLNPTDEIIDREEKIVKQITNRSLNVVSGLARGCDTVAHKTCIENLGKTIAILPTTFYNIYPKGIKKLVEDIVKNGGVVITEYITEPQNKYERIKRFIERDRLQAMFSKAVILIASYTQGNGDSGSRHAMQKAKEYGKKRFVMFNEKTDKNQTIFGLNEKLIRDDIIILTEKSIKEI